VRLTLSDRFYTPTLIRPDRAREEAYGFQIEAEQLLANLHTICWFQSSQCHRGVSSRALNTIGRTRRCHTNLRESPEMRFVSTALVMMTITLMLLALMLLGPAAHAKSDALRSEPCWCKWVTSYQFAKVAAEREGEISLSSPPSSTSKPFDTAIPWEQQL
jgi:hypothetical protein